MRRIFLWLAAGLWAVITSTAAPARAAEELVDGIAAQVGDGVVLISEVMAVVAGMEEKLREAGAPESEIAKLRAGGLERMIEEKLVESEVRRLELYATDEEIDEAIAVIAQDNGLTVEQLEASVKAQNLPMEEYRAAIKSKVEQRKVMSTALGSKVTVDEEEVKSMYKKRFSDQPKGGEQVHVRQILVPAGPSKNMQTACAEVRAAYDRIVAGEGFEVVATEVTAIAGEHGGDIGWLHTDSLASWMADILGSLEPGQFSEVSQQTFGCTILKLVERQAYEPVTYEQAKDALFQQVYQQKLEEEWIRWMDELREHTYIKRRGYFADAAKLGGSKLEDPTQFKEGPSIPAPAESDPLVQ